MALVRVYCGLASADSSARSASAESRLTAAVVDDAGRLLDVRELSDDPAGYARLGTLLVERSGGSNGIAIAADSDDHLVTSLLTAAGRPLVVVDDDAADDYAERFADDDSAEEMQAPQLTRRAIGLARAVQAGALSAVTVPTPRDLLAYKPVLAAHAALSNGRLAAAIALREVLRELYPAALRAYPDPAQQVPLAVLDALPEPGQLAALPAGGRDGLTPADEVVAQLAARGVADHGTLGNAVTALGVAISETPHRGAASKAITEAVAETVRHAIAAVRAFDAAGDALLSTLAARGAVPAAGRRAAGRRAAPTPAPGSHVVGEQTTADRYTTREPAPAPTRTGGRRSRPEPAATNAAPATPYPLTTPPVAPAPIAPPPVAPRPVSPPPTSPQPMAPAAALPSRQPGPAPSSRPQPAPSSRPVSAPPPPPPGITPILPSPRGTVPPAETGEPFRPTLTTAAINNARAERRRTVIPPRANTRAAAADANTTTGGFSATDYTLSAPIARPAATDAHTTQEPGSRANWPLVTPTDDQAGPPADRQPSLDQQQHPADRQPSLDRQQHPADRQPSAYPAAGSFDRPPQPAPPAERPPAERPRPVERPAAERPAPTERRVTPPWQADDLPAEPPTLRLVEPADGGLSGGARGSDQLDTPPLRLLEAEEHERTGRAARARNTTTALDRSSAPPVSNEGDGDLLIFAAAHSAWFTGHEEEVDREWSSMADTGWRAAEQAARPAVGAETSAGLPKRVPQANLVPGSPLREERPLRIIRDAASIAAHTTGYFRGWRRGQEIGGYAIGGRPGREAAGGWDFTRDNGEQGEDREYEYRSAGRRS